MSTESGPKWWVLYLGVGVLMGLFVAEGQLPLSETEHRVIEVGMLLLAYFLGNLWLSANRRGLLRDSYREYRSLAKRTRTEPTLVKDTATSRRNRNKTD